MTLLGDTTGRWLVKQRRRRRTALAQAQRRPTAPLPAHRLDAAAAGPGDEPEKLLMADDQDRHEIKRSR